MTVEIQVEQYLVASCVEMGKAAHSRGLQHFESALDPAFSKVLGSLEYGIHSFHQTIEPYCTAWQKGWDEANRENPQVEVIDTNKFKAVLVQDYDVCETSRKKYANTGDERLTLIRPNPNGLYTLWVRKDLA
jgi:hypothetical protein